MIRVFAPLRPDSPIVDSDDCLCPLCKKHFRAGDRLTLTPARLSEAWESVPAIALHATCSLAGAHTPLGIVKEIRGGQDHRCVVMEDGSVRSLQEVGFRDG